MQSLLKVEALLPGDILQRQFTILLRCKVQNLLLPIHCGIQLYIIICLLCIAVTKATGYIYIYIKQKKIRIHRCQILHTASTYVEMLKMRKKYMHVVRQQKEVIINFVDNDGESGP